MKKTKEFTREEVLVDIKFLLEQYSLIEHLQDYDKIKDIRKKYGYRL